MPKYKFTRFTYPKDYFGGAAGKTVAVVDPCVPGLMIVPFLGHSDTHGDIRRRCAVMHVATAYNFSEHSSIRAALETAKKAGALCDFTRFKTVAGWNRIVKRDKELCKKLKAIAGR